MKKRIFILLSMALCFLMVLTGCGATEVNYFGPTSLSTFDYYTQNMLEGFDFVRGCVNSVQGLQNADKSKMTTVMSAFMHSLADEIAVMACIECFNGVGVDETAGTRVGYYELDGVRYKVSYDNSQRTYVVEYTHDGVKKTKAYSVSKADSVYNVIKKVSSGETPCSVLVQFDTTTSNLTLDITTKDTYGSTLKIKKEMIILKNGEIVAREVATIGDTNNKSTYTVEYLKTVFNADIKIAKSSADAGRINKEVFDKETFVSVSTVDLAGYKIVADLSEQSFTATTFGETSAWLV